MTCDRCQSHIDDYVDNALSVDDRKDVETHLVECAACRAMAEDFVAIRRTSRDLERHTPPPQAWTRLAAALETERKRGFFGRIFVGAWQPFDRAQGWPLAAAATLIVILAGGSWMLWRQPATADRPTQTTESTTTSPELVQSVETELKLAEAHYQKAIVGLEQITRSESSSLDPQVAAVLQKNLEVIDQAIGESRAALQTQPTNEVAQESLFEALRNKVSLLQDTVALINEMRKGNQEGAARVISGRNQ